MIKRVLFASTFLVSVSPLSANVCQNVFFDGIKLESSKFSPEKQDSAEHLPAMLSQILKMSATTLNESISPKYTSEKGQITLGHKLVDGWTLEFNYNRDARTNDPAYRLSDIQVIQPNGESSKLSKSPTTADGNQFSKSQFSLADLAEAKMKIPLGDNFVNIEAPVLMRGELAKTLDTWIPHIEFINRDKLRLSQEADLRGIKNGARFKANVQYTREIIKKQSFKFVLIGLAMYVYLQKDQASDFLFTKDPWSDLVKNSSFSNLGFQEQQSLYVRIRNVTDLQLNEDLVSYNKNRKSFSVNAYNDVSEILTKTNDLKQIEKKLGGSTLTYVFKNGELVDSNPQKILSVANSKSEDSISLAFVYPASKRLVFVTDILIQENEQESFLTLAVDGAEEPELYNQLKNTLANLNK